MTNTALHKTEQRNDAVQRESTQSVYFTPRVDIRETADELFLYADVPGVKAEDVDIRFEHGELTLHARCAPRATGGLLVEEYGVGDYYRVFSVSEAVDSTRISADLKNGVLTIRLPKSEKVKPRRIAVQGG